MAEVVGIEYKFYQKLEGGRKPQIKVETVERLGRPFGLEVWQLFAPLALFRRAKVKIPPPKMNSRFGPRLKSRRRTTD